MALAKIDNLSPTEGRIATSIRAALFGQRNAFALAFPDGRSLNSAKSPVTNSMSVAAGEPPPVNAGRSLSIAVDASFRLTHGRAGGLIGKRAIER